MLSGQWKTCSKSSCDSLAVTVQIVQWGEVWDARLQSPAPSSSDKGKALAANTASHAQNYPFSSSTYANGLAGAAGAQPAAAGCPAATMGLHADDVGHSLSEGAPFFHLSAADLRATANTQRCGARWYQELALRASHKLFAAFTVPVSLPERLAYRSDLGV